MAHSSSDSEELEIVPDTPPSQYPNFSFVSRVPVASSQSLSNYIIPTASTPTSNVAAASPESADVSNSIPSLHLKSVIEVPSRFQASLRLPPTPSERQIMLEEETKHVMQIQGSPPFETDLQFEYRYTHTEEELAEILGLTSITADAGPPPFDYSDLGNFGNNLNQAINETSNSLNATNANDTFASMDIDTPPMDIDTPIHIEDDMSQTGSVSLMLRNSIQPPPALTKEEAAALQSQWEAVSDEELRRDVLAFLVGGSNSYYSNEATHFQKSALMFYRYPLLKNPGTTWNESPMALGRKWQFDEVGFEKLFAGHENEQISTGIKGKTGKVKVLSYQESIISRRSLNNGSYTTIRAAAMRQTSDMVKSGQLENPLITSFRAAEHADAVRKLMGQKVSAQTGRLEYTRKFKWLRHPGMETVLETMAEDVSNDLTFQVALGNSQSMAHLFLRHRYVQSVVPRAMVQALVPKDDFENIRIRDFNNDFQQDIFDRAADIVKTKGTAVSGTYIKSQISAKLDQVDFHLSILYRTIRQNFLEYSELKRKEIIQGVNLRDSAGQLPDKRSQMHDLASSIRRWSDCADSVLTRIQTFIGPLDMKGKSTHNTEIAPIVFVYRFKGPRVNSSSMDTEETADVEDTQLCFDDYNSHACVSPGGSVELQLERDNTQRSVSLDLAELREQWATKLLASLNGLNSQKASEVHQLYRNIYIKLFEDHTGDVADTADDNDISFTKFANCTYADTVNVSGFGYKLFTSNLLVLSNSRAFLAEYGFNELEIAKLYQQIAGILAVAQLLPAYHLLAPLVDRVVARSLETAKPSVYSRMMAEHVRLYANGAFLAATIGTHLRNNKSPEHIRTWVEHMLEPTQSLENKDFSYFTVCPHGCGRALLADIGPDAYFRYANISRRLSIGCYDCRRGPLFCQRLNELINRRSGYPCPIELIRNYKFDPQALILIQYFAYFQHLQCRSLRGKCVVPVVVVNPESA